MQSDKYTPAQIKKMLAKAKKAAIMSEDELAAFKQALEKQKEYRPGRVNLLKLHDKKHPTCCTLDQYLLWREIKPEAGMSGFCTDCTPQYQHECLINDCCDHPEVVFVIDDDGIIEGTNGERVTKEIITYKKWKEMQNERVN